MKTELVPDMRPNVLVLTTGDRRNKMRRTMRQMRRDSFWSCYYTTHHLNQQLQEGHELQQLVVVLVHEPALDGNPVGQLETTCHSSAGYIVFMINYSNKKHTSFFKIK